ncbi:histidine--tRNA ligase [soil metagenome]
MPDLQSPRGTRDILPEEQPLWEFAKATASRVASSLGFAPITTPTYEYKELFQRAIGEGTDVMDKELFLIRSRASLDGEESYALRPEGTAGIVRAFIEHGMHLRPQPVKLTSFINCFRYDRPQKGRYREHVQFDVELFGEKGPFSDALIILATYRFLTELGLTGLKLHLNSLGLSEERKAYQDALVAALSSKKGELSEDSQKRLEVNPLRILDSKDRGDQALIASIPELSTFFGETSASHFAQVQEYLTAWQIPFELNPRLVRGLDYYSHTAFEWTTEGAGGQQSSLGGGGRYDGLLIQLGGKDCGAVGAGIGLDRVVEELERQGITPPVAVKPETVAVILATPTARLKAAGLVSKFLWEGKQVIANFDRDTVGAQFKQADRAGAKAAYILGNEELANGTVTIKDLASGEQHTEPLA